MKNSCLAGALAALAVVATACAAGRQPAPASIVEITRSENPALFIGEGRVAHAPEFVELTVTVHSECYRSPLEASRATDEAAAQVMSLLRDAIDRDNPKDGVFSSGGYTAPFSRYVSPSLTVCEGTFQKTSTIVMKTSRLAEFPNEYAALQTAVLSGALRRADDERSEAGVTYASLGVPMPQLYYETREQLEQQALADALDNARDKLDATSRSACGQRSHGILKFVEREPGSGRPIAYGAVEPMGAEGAAVELDAIWINKLLEVYFVIEPGVCKS